MKQFYVYIMSSDRGTLYTGVSSNLERRVYEHREKITGGFTSKYNVYRLVYFETTDDAVSAIAREKQIKGWRRSKKTSLIASTNPGWVDLADEWSESPATPRPFTAFRVTE